MLTLDPLNYNKEEKENSDNRVLSPISISILKKKYNSAIAMNNNVDETQNIFLALSLGYFVQD